MNTIHIHTQLDSTTLTLPEIAPLIGKQVEIIVREEDNAKLPPGFTPGTGDWEAFDQAVEALRDTFDYAALEEQEVIDKADMAKNAKMWK